MKKYLNLLIAVGIVFGPTSCQEITCPEFNEEILTWIPYQEDDKIELYSQLKDSTIIVLINSVVVTHTTSYNTGKDCGHCDDDIHISGSNFYVEIYLKDGKTRSQNIRLGDSHFSAYSESKKFLFDNKEYEVARTFDSSSGMFKKLIMAKDIGIIGLIDIHDNTWILKTDIKNRKSSEPRRITINNRSC
ncbi:MAG: hypothetical protein LBE79_12680 [Tannerella sp.]|jgi:hypothetical protein|nr:hypothetical protein [Tannerella sp.]